jgi:hypothetical protein
MTTTLMFHVTAGAIGLLSGAAALAFRKGSPPHRAAGNLFLVAILAMSASGAYVALTKPVAASLNGLVAALTLYLAATAWMTVRRKAGEIGLSEYGALLMALATGAAGLAFGWQAATSEAPKDGIPAAMYYVFAGVALFAAALDVRMIARGGVAGAQRIARHLWRMCFALLIGATAFFIGQAKVFPPSVRETQILVAPVIAIVVLMVFWLVRVRFTKWYRARLTAGALDRAETQPASPGPGTGPRS